MKASTKVRHDDRTVFIISIVLLGATITADIYSHFCIIKHVPFFWKIILSIQAIIAINVCAINALCVAGQDNPVDILMTTTGLLVLNELDDAVGYVFAKYAEIEEDDYLEQKTDRYEKQFAIFLSGPHIVFMGYYTLWFIGWIQYDRPKDGYDMLRFWNPFSMYFFPIVITASYCFFYKFLKHSIIDKIRGFTDFPFEEGEQPDLDGKQTEFKKLTNLQGLGTRFAGEVIKGTEIPHGRGKRRFVNGTVYEGWFKEGQAEGYGRVTQPDGSQYIGDWLDDKQEGQGNQTWPNGSSYTGQFKNGMKFGQGVFKWADGSSTVGEFDEDGQWKQLLWNAT